MRSLESDVTSFYPTLVPKERPQNTEGPLVVCSFGGFPGSANIHIPPAPPHAWTLLIQRPEEIKVYIMIHGTTSQHTEQSSHLKHCGNCPEQLLIQGVVCLEK